MLLLVLTRVLNEEGWHRVVEHGEVDRHRYRSTSLSLMPRATVTWSIDVDTPAFLEHAYMSLCIIIWLRSRAETNRGYRRGDGHLLLLERVVAGFKRFERNQAGQLATENLGVPSKMMDHYLRSLLIFCEVTALEETTRSGGVHEEIGWSIELDDQPTRPSGFHISIFQEDILDESERVFDLVAGLVVIDVVCHASLLWSIEDDQVHRVLTHSSPGTNTQ